MGLVYRFIDVTLTVGLNDLELVSDSALVLIS